MWDTCFRGCRASGKYVFAVRIRLVVSLDVFLSVMALVTLDKFEKGMRMDVVAIY